MKTPWVKQKIRTSRESLVSEFLILPDGRILVHNLTQPFAELLHKMNPADAQISPRVSRYLPSSRKPGRDALLRVQADRQDGPAGLNVHS